MKKNEAIVLLALMLGGCFLVAGYAWAATVTLAWDASPSPEVSGYNIYVGPASRTYTNIVNAGNYLQCTVTNLKAGSTYYFAATAYDTNGLESDFSNEVSYTVPTNPPNRSLCSQPGGMFMASP